MSVSVSPSRRSVDVQRPSAATVTFGERLLRLDTPGHQRFMQAESFGAR